VNERYAITGFTKTEENKSEVEETKKIQILEKPRSSLQNFKKFSQVLFQDFLLPNNCKEVANFIFFCKHLQFAQNKIELICCLLIKASKAISNLKVL